MLVIHFMECNNYIDGRILPRSASYQIAQVGAESLAAPDSRLRRGHLLICRGSPSLEQAPILDRESILGIASLAAQAKQH